MIKPLLSLKRLNFEEKEGKMSYQYEKESLKREKMDYLESQGVRPCLEET